MQTISTAGEKHCKWTELPLANANVSLDAATIKIEQLQIELNHKNTNKAILTFLPKLLKAI